MVQARRANLFLSVELLTSSPSLQGAARSVSSSSSSSSSSRPLISPAPPALKRRTSYDAKQPNDDGEVEEEGEEEEEDDDDEEEEEEEEEIAVFYLSPTHLRLRLDEILPSLGRCPSDGLDDGAPPPSTGTCTVRSAPSHSFAVRRRALFCRGRRILLGQEEESWRLDERLGTEEANKKQLVKAEHQVVVGGASWRRWRWWRRLWTAPMRVLRGPWQPGDKTS